MSNAIIQASFNAGEWSPALGARVDMQRYHSAAALLRNFFVDYRGGATTRPGSRYIIQTISGTAKVRLIPFQASQTVSYILVFENQKLYFINNGSPVLESPLTITNVTNANPAVVSVVNSYTNGDRVFISGLAGTIPQINNSYFIVANRTAGSFSLNDLNGNPVNSTTFGTYVSGGQVQRVYTITSPYLSTELSQIKYAQDVNLMVLNHPNYPTYKLVLTSATSWSLTIATFGSTVSAPTGVTVTPTAAAGNFHYDYVITAVDANGQESAPSAFGDSGAVAFMGSGAQTHTITWNPVTGAVSYNVYKTTPRLNAAPPAGVPFGFIGNCTGTTFIDSTPGLDPDFSQSAPIIKNPFAGSGVQSVTVTLGGSYAGANFPAIGFIGGGGSGAQAQAVVQATIVSLVLQGNFYAVGDLITLTQGVVIRVTGISGGGTLGPISNLVIVNQGNCVISPVPSNAQSQLSTTGRGTGATFSITWSVTSISVVQPGAGYGSPPTVTFTPNPGAPAATATIGAPVAGNPTVPVFHQQRLALMGPISAPNQFNASQPGSFFNFNVTDPVQPDNAFFGTLNSTQLNSIQSAVSQPQGLIIFSDRLAWLLNGGSAGSPISATLTVANAQIFNGASALPPIVAVDDILYVQSKGSIVRDLIFNFQKQVYTGADISVQSSHLFFGYQILEWAYAEEPFKLIWAVRSDGQLLCLTFLREQELVAWTHCDTSGSYKSVASVTEPATVGNVDAVYTVVQRVINGVTVQYIERFTDLYYPVGATDAWQVDAGIQYNGTAALTFFGAQHLANTSVTGIATDDTGLFSVFTVTVNSIGSFTLPAPTAPATGYTRVTAGLSFTAQLQTLALDLGEPTVQGKRKKVSAVTARVRQTLGLTCGRTFSTLQTMKDLVVGNVGTMSNTVVTDLVTSDARIIVDPQFDVFGQYCFQQTTPYPATILGVIPEIEIGDSPK